MTVADALAMARQYYATGQLPAAEHLFRYVLHVSPDHPGALHSLGQILFLSGKLTESMAALRQATVREPNNADFWNDLGVVCCKAGVYADAQAACEQAVRLRPNFAEAHSNLGFALLYQGDHPRAVAVLEEAIRLKPDLADAHSNLGVALKAMDRIEEAAKALCESVRLNPRNADAANMAGMVLQHCGEMARAMDYYRHALAVKPDYTDALSNLATALKEQGDLEQAVSLYRQVLALQPDHVLAYYNLSELAADGRYQFSPDELARLYALQANEAVQPLFRSVAGFALGAVLDARGDYDQAFACFQRANDLRREWLRSNKRSFDENRQRAFVSDIITTFDSRYFEQAAKAGPHKEEVIFVLGMPRSGTTLISQILGSHPTVFSAGEVGEFPRIVAEITGTTGSLELPRPVPLPSVAAARDVAARYLRRLVRFAEGRTRVTVKLPENVFYMGMLAMLYPQAKMIYCRRDPRDVCLSCYFHNFQAMDYSFSLEHIAAYYREYERLMEHWQQVLPLPILEVHYEELLADQEGVTRAMLEHCGLEWDDRCLSFYKTRRVVQTASVIQVRKPLTKKPMGRWKNYRAHLGPLLQALGDLVDPDEEYLPKRRRRTTPMLSL